MSLRVGGHGSLTGYVGGAVGVVLVHQPGPGAVEPGHGVHGALVGLAHVLLGDDELDPVPPLGLVEPLVGVDGDLGAEGLGEDEHVPDDGGVGDDELVGLADGGGDPADGAPGVHDGLSSGDGGAGLEGAVLEAAHHEGHGDVALLLGHLGGDGEQHEHVVALGDAHGVEVAEDVGAGDLA